MTMTLLSIDCSIMLLHLLRRILPTNIVVVIARLTLAFVSTPAPSDKTRSQGSESVKNAAASVTMNDTPCLLQAMHISSFARTN